MHTMKYQTATLPNKQRNISEKHTKLTDVTECVYPSMPYTPIPTTMSNNNLFGDIQIKIGRRTYEEPSASYL